LAAAWAEGWLYLAQGSIPRVRAGSACLVEGWVRRWVVRERCLGKAEGERLQVV